MTGGYAHQQGLPSLPHHDTHHYVQHEMMITPGSKLGMDGESSSDDEGPSGHHGGGGRSTAMMFDRSLVGDRNNLKTLIIRAVYENQIHLQTRKGDAFDQLAQSLGMREEFKPYKLHGRKLQKSFNKIARDIKDCILQENEPSRWGKEEPEFFVVARKIFEEARRAGIRAFDEKLKSKSIADRLGEDGSAAGDESAKKRKKREHSYGGGGVGRDSMGGNMMGVQMPLGVGFTGGNHSNASLPMYPHDHVAVAASANNGGGASPSNNPAGKYLRIAASDVTSNASDLVHLNPEFMKLIEDFINAKFQLLQQAQLRLNSHEIEASLAHVLDKFVNVYNLRTVGALLDAAGLSDFTKGKIYETTHFNYDDNVKLFLVQYCDVMMRSPQAIRNIQEAFGGEIPPRDAAVLYTFIDQIAGENNAAAAAVAAANAVAANNVPVNGNAPQQQQQQGGAY